MEKNKSDLISSWLLNPWLDRLSALFIASLSALLIYHHDYQMSLIYILFLVSQLQIILIFLFRRPAKRIETNPWVLAISLLRLFWPFILFSMGDPAAPRLIDIRITDAIACLLFGLIIYSRQSLGRSLGCFPADRKIVVNGAYAFVRHPIQGLEILFFFNFLLSCFTWKIGAMTLIGAGIYFLKSRAEEHFLCRDEEYRKYKEHVRWRFFPFVV
jgi:protein-S-isoprenylcysteine O-methyltransferase Ste14